MKSNATTRTKGIAAAVALTLLTGCQVTPNALTESEISDYALDKMARVTADQEPISGQVSLYQAMARALKYNLDYKVEIMNRQLANKNLRLKSAGMLPKVVANAGWADRNNSPASYSQTLFAGVRSVDPSFSKQNSSFAGDVTFSWHMLDFGLSYIRAQQAAGTCGDDICRGDVDAAQTRAQLADGMWISGAVLAAGAVALWALSGEPPIDAAEMEADR